jgi:Tol biopolymer transport system component
MAEARDLRLCPTIPTAHKITFSSNRDGNFEIYVMNTDGTNQTRLTNNSASDGNPVWSPDGSKIAFSSDRDGNYEIYVMNADGTNPVRLTNNSAADAEPSWSPDGTKIAFSTNRDGIISGDMTTPGVNWEVYVMNVDGINPVNLTNNSTPNPYYNNSLEGDPRWSPDGSKILFGSWRSGDARVWVMNADGTNPTQLSPISWSGSGRWSPDGSKISYSAWANSLAQPGSLPLWMGTRSYVERAFGAHPYSLKGGSGISR